REHAASEGNRPQTDRSEVRPRREGLAQVRARGSSDGQDHASQRGGRLRLPAYAFDGLHRDGIRPGLQPGEVSQGQEGADVPGVDGTVAGPTLFGTPGSPWSC